MSSCAGVSCVASGCCWYLRLVVRQSRLEQCVISRTDGSAQVLLPHVPVLLHSIYL